MKTIITISFLLLTSFCSAQTYLKGNMLYWAVGITNVGIETKIGDKLTINTDLVYSPWKSISGNHFEFFQVIPELRFYPKKAYDGFYVGGYVSFQAFNITKWNYWNKGQHQVGRGAAAGVTIGYTYSVSSKLILDCYLGAGRQGSRYKGYMTADNRQYVGWNGSGEWLPYKVGIAIGYKL